MTVTTIWEPIPNSVIPQCWGYNLQWIRNCSGDYSLKETNSYSLSFQKEHLHKYHSDYYLDSTTRQLYKLLERLYLVEYINNRPKDFNVFETINEFEKFRVNNDMRYCAGYNKEVLAEKFKSKRIVTIGEKHGYL